MLPIFLLYILGLASSSVVPETEKIHRMGTASARRSFFRTTTQKTVEDSEQCSLKCMRDMKEKINNDEDFNEFILKQSQPFRFHNQFDIEMLTKYCKRMNKTVDCINPCPDGTIKDIAAQALSMSKHMCSETKFFQFASCYGDVAKRMENFCHSETKCGPKKINLENRMASPLNSLHDISSLLIQTCQYINCYNDCDRQDMILECGREANEILESLFAKSIQVMKNMFKTLRLPVSMPAECKRIRAKLSMNPNPKKVVNLL